MMKKTRKILSLALTAALLFALLLSSCSAPGSAQTETAEPTPTTPPVSTPMPGRGERTTITIGTIDFGDEFRALVAGQLMIEQAALTFNASSTEYKIDIVYYGKFSMTSNDVLLAVNSALSSADHVPDLLCLNGLPYEAYIQRGLLMDLYPFMDADKNLKREDMLPCVREASEVDGKMFFLSPDCEFTLFGGNSESLMTEDFADTEQIFRALEAHQDEGRTLQEDMTAEQVENFIANPAVLDRFVDYESGTCSFQSEEFLRVLELLNRLPRSVPQRLTWDASSTPPHSALWVTEGYSTIYWNYLLNFKDYVELETLMEGDYVPAEYPFSDGKYGLCMLRTPVAIPANAKHPEAAWKFIRYLFQCVDDSKFPTTYSGLESMLTLSRLPELWEIQREGKEDVREQMRQYMEDPYGVPLGPVVPVLTYPFTEEVYEELLEFLKKPMILSVGCVEHDWKHTELQNIISDEINTFLNGNATAEQTAQALQSRVEIYLAEQT